MTIASNTYLDCLLWTVKFEMINVGQDCFIKFNNGDIFLYDLWYLSMEELYYQI